MDCLRRLPTTHDGSLDVLLETFGAHLERCRARPVDVLEIACGSARLSLEVVRRFDGAVGVVRPSDTNPAIVSMLQPFHSERFRPLLLDATRPQAWQDCLDGHDVDFIVSHGALRYFHGDLDAAKLGAWSSVLRPGGVVLFSDVNSRAFEVPSAFAALRDRLCQAGFTHVDMVALTCRVFEMTRFYRLVADTEDLSSLDLDTLVVQAGYRDDTVYVLSARWGVGP